MKVIYLILTLIFIIFSVTFSQMNSVSVRLQYYFLQTKYLDVVVPAYMLIFGSLLAGVIITSLWGIVERFRLNRTISRLNRTIRDLRKELRVNEPPPIVDEPKKQ
ncbi:MAG: LapA family protein [Smithellaceae bacterium]|jgi:uncharacterized integral membrane protein